MRVEGGIRMARLPCQCMYCRLMRVHTVMPLHPPLHCLWSRFSGVVTVLYGYG